MSTPLFDAMHEIGERLEKARNILVCLDFDGTLAPLVDDPARVSLSPHIRRVLTALGDCPRVSLAILSGRERADLQNRVNIPGAVYAGNHGLEISGPGFLFLEPTAVERAELLREFTKTLKKQVSQIDGVFVEDKGLTITVHYRQAPNGAVDNVRRVVHSALAGSSHPFLLTTGDKIYEIRPRVYWNKGNAVEWIKERLQKADALIIYLGDDVTDEDAFAALQEGITIKVGESTETAAHYHLQDLLEVRKFLDWLFHLLCEEDKSRGMIGSSGETAMHAGPA
jgi:trehalose 6-phosphate phosphatase